MLIVFFNQGSGNTAPAAPSNLVALPALGVAINLSWDDNDPLQEDGFLLERSTDEVSYVQVATPDAGTTSYLDQVLLPGKLYFYRLRSFNSGGNSEYSNVAS